MKVKVAAGGIILLMIISGCKLFYGDVNLVTASVDAPWCSGRGAEISIDVVLSNNGTAASKAFSVNIYLSEDQFTDPSDLLIGTVSFDAGISALGEETATAAVQLPSDLDDGIYYIGAIADPEDDVWETDETDNGYFFAFGQSINISDPEHLTFSYSVDNPVFVLPASTFCSTIVTIEGSFLGTEDLFLVKTNVADSEVAASMTGRVASGWGVPETRNLPQARTLGEEGGVVVLKDYGPAAAFNADPPPFVSSRGLSAQQSIVTLPQQATVGDSELFWVQDANGIWIQISATVRAVGLGGYSAVWIADANYDNGSGSSTDNMLTSAQADALAVKFDGTSAQNWDDGIYEGITNIFGFEYGGNGGGGGVDGEAEIHMLLYDIDYDYSASQSLFVAGYFWSKDEYSDADMQAQFGLRSNEKEMFYLDVNYFDQFPDGMYSTMAHEFQHMIHFNKKWIEHSQDSPTWYNEMCSMVAEDFLYDSLATTLYESHPSGRLQTFADGYVNSGVTDWGNTLNVLENYASAYFFGAYLARNYGSAGFFSNLLENSTTGVESINAALAASGYSGETFDTIFREYAPALIYSTPPGSSSVKVFEEVIENYGGIGYTLPEININHLDLPDFPGGLTAFDPSTQIDLRPYGTSIHTSPEWTNLSSAPYTVSVERSQDQDVVLFFMIRD